MDSRGRVPQYFSPVSAQPATLPPLLTWNAETKGFVDSDPSTKLLVECISP